MMSVRRPCLSVSGPGAPSRRRSMAPWIDVSGDRSSCETLAKNSDFVSAIWPSWLAALEQRLLLGDDAPVPLERHVRLTEVQRLPLAHRVLGEAPEILGDLSRPLGPRPRVARVAQHERARLEPRERRDRLAGGRGEAERGDGLGRDLAIDEDETIHGKEAHNADAREHDDHQRGGQEDLRAEPHGLLGPTTLPLPLDLALTPARVRGLCVVAIEAPQDALHVLARFPI